MDYKDVAIKGEQELKTLLAEERAKLRGLRFQVSERQLKNVRTIREAKRTIARILTKLSNAKQ